MIVQNVGHHGATDLSFTIPRVELGKAKRILEPIVRELGFRELTPDSAVAKVSIVGAGIHNTPGYAARMFQTLAEAVVNIEMISTSEIRITCMIAEDQVETAVRALHAAFELERPDPVDAAAVALLSSLGVQIETVGNHTWRIQARQVRPADLDPDICRRIRASILLAGPMIARAGELNLPPPGGDVIGRRRVDTHILALTSLGAQVEFDRVNRLFRFPAPKLTGTDILMDEASVTANENAIMAAVTAKGQTTIHNAASEPHIQEWCHFLNKLGAQIENIGSNTLHILGVPRLHGGEFTIGPDYLEVVSFIGATVITHGSVRIRNAGAQYLNMIRLVFQRLGVVWQIDGDDLIIPAEQELVIEPDLGGAIPNISVMPWPSFPTDLMSIAIVVATQSQGSVLFHDWMYPSRMFFTDNLVGMARVSFYATPIVVWCKAERSCMVKNWKARIFAQAWPC